MKNPFDFNHDGKMNAFERAAACQFLDDMAKKNDTDSSLMNLLPVHIQNRRM